MSESLKHKAIKGVMWSAVERFAVQGVQFAFGIFIARLVAPAEYGLIAMLSIFLAVAQIFIDSGFSSALVQKRERTNIDFDTVFYFSTVISILIYLILFFSAPYIASFYNEPVLDKLLKFMGLGVIVSNFAIIQRTKISIALNFKLLARISLISIVVSGGIGIFMATQGYGVWALATLTLVNTALSTLLLLLFVRWLPSWNFSIASFKGLFSFGSKLLLGGLLHVVYTNLYTLVIGKKFHATDLGFFSRAQAFAVFPTISLTEISTRPLYPLMCQIQDDPERLRDVFMKYLRMMIYLIFPLMIGLSVLSAPFIDFVLTKTWIDAAPLLSILCLSYMWYPMMNINWNLLNVKGRSDLSLKAEIIKKIVAFAILVATIPFGLTIMCWGLVLYSLFDVAIIIFFVRKVIDIGYRRQFFMVLPILCAAVLMGGSVYLVSLLFASSVMQLIVGILSGVLFYALFSALLKIPELQSVVKIFHRKSQ